MRETLHSRSIGLARALSKLGYCSRSQAWKIIEAGRVRISGKICPNPEAPVSLERDRIEVDGEAIAAAAKVYLAFNKPRGVVTTAADEHDRTTVYAFLDGDQPWVAPVGRLDKASEGLLFLTNDSEWSARILAPATHLDKTYHVQIASVADESLLAALLKGMTGGHEFLCAKRASILRGGKRNTWLEIVLDEGKNRHIRRMMQAFDIEVLRLVRVAIGTVALGDLAKGRLRPLTVVEKKSLDSRMAKAYLSRPLPLKTPT